MRFFEPFKRLRAEEGEGDSGGGDGAAAESTATATQEAPEGSAAPAGGETPSSPFGSFYGDQGLNREAVEKLPDSYKPIKSLLEKYPSEEAFIGGVKNLQYLAGQKSLQPLPADADEAQKEQHSKMVKEYFGVPDSPEGYGIQKPEDVPDELWDEKSTNDLVGILHKHNASPDMVRELTEYQVNAMKAAVGSPEEQHAAHVESVNKDLKAKFGNELGQVSEAGLKGLKMLGVEIPESGQVADLHIGYAEILAAGKRMTELIGEDPNGRAKGGNNQATAGSYKQQAEAIKDGSDPSNKFYQDFTSEEPARQKRAQAEYRRLMDLAQTLEGSK